MTNQIPTNNEVPSEALRVGPPGTSNTIQPEQISSQTTPTWKKLAEKIKITLINLFNHFYSNKKLFWPVSIAFGLILLLIVVGLLFGKRTKNAGTIELPTPPPIVQSTPEASMSGDILLDSQKKLLDLKNQINALDIKQSRLKPPTLNFNIKF